MFLSLLNTILFFFKSKVSSEALLLNSCYWPLESSHFPDCETNCYIRRSDTNQMHKLPRVTCTTFIKLSWFSNHLQSLDFTTKLALGCSLKTNPWKFAKGRTWWKLESSFLPLHGTPLNPPRGQNPSCKKTPPTAGAQSLALPEPSSTPRTTSGTGANSAELPSGSIYSCE